MIEKLSMQLDRFPRLPFALILYVAAASPTALMTEIHSPNETNVAFVCMCARVLNW